MPRTPLDELTALSQTPSWSPGTSLRFWLLTSNFGSQECPLQDKFLAMPMSLDVCNVCGWNIKLVNESGWIILPLHVCTV